MSGIELLVVIHVDRVLTETFPPVVLLRRDMMNFWSATLMIVLPVEAPGEVGSTSDIVRVELLCNWVLRGMSVRGDAMKKVLL